MGALKLDIPRAQLKIVERREDILIQATSGLGVHDICENIGVNVRDFYEYLETDPLFKNHWETSRLRASHVLADKVLDISRDETLNPQVQRNQIQSNQWLASKRNSKVYGDKMDINISATIDVTGILDAAERRVAATSQPDLIVDAQVLEITNVSDTCDTGLEPVKTKSGLDISDLI